MTLDYYQVMPDRIALLGGHFTPGRDAIKGLVRHHTAGVLDADDINRIWSPNGGRQASTNYLSDVVGDISQHVWDGDAAWANAHSWANRNLLSQEHSNSAGPPGWPITDETIIGGARWGAALARFYKWGVPEYNVNIFDHRDFTSTSCPHHLAHPSGKYNDPWLEESTWFYGQLMNGLVDGQGNPIKFNFPPETVVDETPKKERIFMYLTEAEEREILTSVRELKNALLTPVPSQVEGSNVEISRVHMIDQADRKIEELHVKSFSEPSTAQRQLDVNLRIERDHKLEDEDHHDGGES